MEHSRKLNGRETLRIVVRPELWEEGYLFKVTFSGQDLAVSHEANVRPGVSMGLAVDGSSTFAFVLGQAPNSLDMSFAFNIDGAFVQLESLACRPPLRSPPPPPPPLALPPPYLRINLVSNPPPPPPPPPQGAPPGVLLSAAVLGVVALVVGGSALYNKQQKAPNKVLPLAAVARAGKGKSGMMPVPSNDASSMVSESRSEMFPAPSARAAKAKKGKAGARSGQKESNKKWSLLVQLNGESDQLVIPTSVASNCLELKEAICRACEENLGEDITPEEWMEGELDTMAVQFAQEDGKPMTMKSSTDFKLVLAASTLRITQRQGRK